MTAVRSVALVAVIVLALTARAWGPGHNTVMRIVREKAPAEFRATFKPEWKDLIQAACHGPDGGKLKLFPEADRAWFAAHGFREKNNDLHTQEAALAYYDRLVHALRTHDYLTAWVAVGYLSHVFADDAAANHAPLAHLVTYIWGKGGLAVVPDGVEKAMDFGFCEKNAAAQGELQKALESFKTPGPCAALSPQEAFGRILTFEDASSCAVSQNGLEIVRASMALATERNDDDSRRLARALTPPGLVGVSHTLEMIRLAQAAARCDEQPLPDLQTLKIWRKAFAEKHLKDSVLAKRTIADIAEARPFLPSSASPSCIRIAYDPTGHMRSGVFGCSARALAPFLAGSLRERFPSANVSLTDCREIVRAGVPTETRVLIVYGETIYGWMGFDAEGFRRQLVSFQKAGGSVLWIGGRPPKELAPTLAQTASEIEDRGGYGRPPFPAAGDALMSARISVAGEKTTFAFARRPCGKAGWYWQGCRTVFDAARFGGNAAAALTFKTSDGQAFVQGAIEPARKPNFAYLPGYAVFPYYFSDSKPDPKAFELRMDAAAEAMVSAFVVKLTSKGGR